MRADAGNSRCYDIPLKWLTGTSTKDNIFCIANVKHANIEQVLSVLKEARQETIRTFCALGIWICVSESREKGGGRVMKNALMQYLTTSQPIKLIQLNINCM